MLIQLLISLLVFAVILYVVKIVVDMITLPPQIKTIVWIIVGLIALFYLLGKLGIYHGGI